MKIKVSKDWCVAMAKEEAGVEIGAGLLAADPIFYGEERGGQPHSDDVRLAFGRFVNLMRRARRMTIEKLAEDADLDSGDVMSIEEDAYYVPEPRTVYRLAQAFDVPQNSLMELSGLAKPANDRFVEKVVRYAARSEPTVELSAEEQAALDGFISVLSEQKT